MKIKTLLTTFALAAVMAPSLALAGGCSGKDHANMSCADGQIWDASTRTCVTQTS